MNHSITFRVFGMPRPGGSKSAFYIKKLKRAVVVDASKHLKTWKREVKEAARLVAPAWPLEVPLTVNATFYMPRPKSHFYSGKRAGILREDAPDKHIKRPDALKLMRGTEDAMTGIIYVDDSLIWSEQIMKVYGRSPGAVITIEWEKDNEKE